MTLFRRIVVCSILLVVCGCSVRIDILSASAREFVADNREITKLQIILSRKDLQAISSDELYVTVWVVSCSTKEEKFAALPMFMGRHLSDFDFLNDHLRSTNDLAFEVDAIVERATIEELKGSCVKLDGGSYLLKKIHSTVVPLELRA